MPTATERKLVSSEVFERLLTDILVGAYQPEEKLPTQRALAADLGVTMSSLREALKRLEQMGLIEARQGDAMRVLDWRQFGGLDVISHLVFKAGSFDRGLLEDVFAARSLMLENLAALAAQQRTEEQADRLIELARQIGTEDSSQAAQLIDFAFFTELTQAANNIAFVLILNSIRDLYLQHADQLPLLDDLEELKPLYLQIAEAVKSKDSSKASVVTAKLAGGQWQRVSRTLTEAN